MLHVFFVMLHMFRVVLHVFRLTLQETRATLYETRATLQASASAEYTKPFSFVQLPSNKISCNATTSPQSRSPSRVTWWLLLLQNIDKLTNRLSRCRHKPVSAGEVKTVITLATEAIDKFC